MPAVGDLIPKSRTEIVTDILHGVTVRDPYRWLEDQNSIETREWIQAQTQYGRCSLHRLCGRKRISARVRELLTTDTCDCLIVAGNRYLFRKRTADAEQASIYVREGWDGKDELLIDPAEAGANKYTAVRPLCISPHGDLLLYEIKRGGERQGQFQIFDLSTRKRLPDSLPHGLLRGFAFASDQSGFYYSHEAAQATRPFYRAVYFHRWGAARKNDEEIFVAGEHAKLRLCLTAGQERLGFLVYRFADRTYTSFYQTLLGATDELQSILLDVPFFFSPMMADGKLLALTDFEAPNLRVVQVRPRLGYSAAFDDLIPESSHRIQRCMLIGSHLLLSYLAPSGNEIHIYNADGARCATMNGGPEDTLRIVNASTQSQHFFFEVESFAKPRTLFRYDLSSESRAPWKTDNQLRIDTASYAFTRCAFNSADGTEVPILIFGKKDLLDSPARHPVVMTAYGGFGVSMTPRFSHLVMALVEMGCLFALPQIRGGSEQGGDWHEMGRRRNREKPLEDFIAAAEWLIRSGRTTADQIATFGGSNSGLLVMAAMVRRPELFCAVLSIAPLLDMLRYHLFDSTCAWTDEFGTAEQADDFATLFRYSPYHNVRDCVPYPSVLLVSGDLDHTSNSLHARKMTARLQAATSSTNPIVLDYSKFRGHAPVLPLSTRIESLTDRIAFLANRLGLCV